MVADTIGLSPTHIPLPEELVGLTGCIVIVAGVIGVISISYHNGEWVFP